MRYSLMMMLVLAMVSAAATSAHAADAPRPNVVYILADDMGWADVSFHGPDIKTPNIDKIAASGVRLEQFYVQSVCSPTRAALLTGRYPMRLGSRARRYSQRRLSRLMIAG